MIESILEFWFGRDDADAAEQERLAQRWFVASPEFDAEIRRRFGTLIDMALAGELAVWAQTPRGWLALLLVLDQFPRNLYRDTPQAFAGDGKAQALAIAGIARGDDLTLPARMRPFAYLPLEHAEDLKLQQQSVSLFRRLAADPQAVPASTFTRYVDYALAHQDVVSRFGRFPHRNRLFGRRTTEAEQHYLDEGGGF